MPLNTISVKCYRQKESLKRYQSMSITNHKIAIFTVIFLFYAFSLYCADHGGSALVEIVPQEVYETLAENSITYRFDLPWESTNTYKVSHDYFFNASAKHDFERLRSNEELNTFMYENYASIGFTHDELNLICSKSNNKKIKLQYPNTAPHPQIMLKLLQSADEKTTKPITKPIDDKEQNEQFARNRYHIHLWLVGIIDTGNNTKTIQTLILNNSRPFDGTLDLTEFTKSNTPKLINLVSSFYIKNVLISNNTSIETITFSPLPGYSTQEPLNIIIKKNENETITHYLQPNDTVCLMPPPQPKPVIIPQNPKPKFNLINWFALHKTAVIISFFAGAGTGAGLCYYLWHNGKLKAWR